MEISTLKKYNNNRVWAYNASTLDLISDSFSSMQKAADHFNVDYRSILKHPSLAAEGEIHLKLLLKMIN